MFVAAPVSAQMTGTPTPGYLSAPGVSSNTMPTALREIGFEHYYQAEELGWDGSRDDVCATSKVSAALAARTAVIAKEEEGRL